MKKFLSVFAIFLIAFLAACANNSDSEKVAAASAGRTEPEKVATPAIAFETATNTVTITCVTEGAAVYYTTDGSEPTSSSAKYTAAFTIDATKTIKAVATKDGMTDSDVAAKECVYAAPAPTKVAKPAIAFETATNTVTITCATEGAAIYYTKDGSEPTSSSAKYTAAFTIDATKTIKAVAAKDGMTDSDVAAKECVYVAPLSPTPEKVATPAIAFETATNTVTITCATEGAVIYYTTDGSEPTSSSTAYTEAFTIGETKTIKAVATKDGMTDSDVATEECVYTSAVTPSAIPTPSASDYSLETLGKYTVLPAGAYTSGHTTNAAGTATVTGATYVSFGTFPQTLKADGVTINEETTCTQGGNTYYLGSDYYWYAKCKENAYTSGYKYSDNTDVKQLSANSEKYFKVEPIIWRKLSSNILLAESLLTANIPYYGSTYERTLNETTIYANNYKYSNLRAYLNGIKNQFVTDGGSATANDIDWSDKGFLQIAFTANQQAKIVITEVDNSARSTNPDASATQWNSGNNTYACENTNDKIFLLSEQEATKSAYGFPVYEDYSSSISITTHARMRTPTDYALANYAYVYDATSAGWWWLRSPFYAISDNARPVRSSGLANLDSYNYVNYTDGGVCPALCVAD